MSIRYWLVVQPLDRARLQVEGGFVQVPGGAREPVDAMREADGVVLYSPRAHNPDGEPLRAFVQAGRVLPGEAYQPGGRGASPWRRHIEWMHEARIAPVRPLRDLLEFTSGRYWGEKLRDGWLELTRRDFLIAEDAVRRPAPEPSGLVLGMLRETGAAGAAGGVGDGAPGPLAPQRQDPAGHPAARPVAHPGATPLSWPTATPGGGTGRGRQ
ncbi:hypothetical protein GCM10011490_24830 [Pseudoclavibacter endophyticus]|uniref:EVE domain-containing protein n=1 Tax=Pseudoclavibacter endophyticus TaxID=1778590 RepID=A0A6H9WPI2_9MICO|nr:EVE domain-containing protein [Pseudoclavibacter endophyticus]KAB1647815.1 EVE domain-containing protein [Pseudoclavibacter endophyticus]GGA73052.1 hypothetical protein GCM10011490_24830 [Pseudoclavibacter endophyticus]